MVKSKKNLDIYGLIVIDRSEMTIATLSGGKKNIIKIMSAAKPFKRLERCEIQKNYRPLIEQATQEFFIRAGEHINNQFLSLQLKGIIIGGGGPTKKYFVKGDYLDNRLKEKIIAIIDIGYSGEQGIDDLIKKAKLIL